VTVYPGWDDAQAREESAPERMPDNPELRMFARIEGLVGEEEALLKIPARERTSEQEGRVQELGERLDRLFDRLRQRAERLSGDAETGRA
jgi:hypothetical protein